MKTIRKLCKRFNKISPNYSVHLDEIESYNGYYKLFIADENGIGSWYIFASCKEFSEWMNGVILE